MSSVTETLAKRVKDLSSLNNTLYEKNNDYVKKFLFYDKSCGNVSLSLLSIKKSVKTNIGIFNI